LFTVTKEQDVEIALFFAAVLIGYAIGYGVRAQAAEHDRRELLKTVADRESQIIELKTASDSFNRTCVAYFRGKQ